MESVTTDPKISSNNTLSVNDVQKRLDQFSSEFNSLHRLVLLNCSPEEKANVKFSLLRLKKSITMALEALGTGLSSTLYQFKCGLCDGNITINPKEDFWCSLQAHEHFEELYYQFLQGDLGNEDVNGETVQTNSESESTPTETVDSNTDSGIEQQDLEMHVNSLPPISNTSSSNPTDNINGFRFNFNTSYDPEIEEKLFPSSMMQAIRRYDKVKDRTIMRVGASRAACLICLCELSYMRVNKNTLINHVMGQRHLNAASETPNVDILLGFHDFWLKQERLFQAHLVYFRPFDSNRVKCILCGVSYSYSAIISHISDNKHKRLVMEIYDQGLNIYYLVNLQVQVYNVSIKDIEAKEAELKRLKEVKTSQRAKNSESDDQQRKEARPADITHNIIKSVEKLQCENAIEQLPNRMKEYAAQLISKSTDNETNILCKQCNILLNNNVRTLKNHLINTSAHEVPQYKYYCEICDLQIKNENLWLNHDFTANRHEKIAPGRKAKVTEYECTTCKMVIFGDDISIIRHMSIRNTKIKKEKGGKLTEAVKTLLQSRAHLLSQASLLAGNAELVLKNRLTQDCCSRLESALKEIFTDCKVYPFGSRVSGIGNLESDLDVFVDVGHRYYGQQIQDPADQVVFLREASKVFNRHRDYSRLIKVSTARTPILKLHHLPTKLACDLSFKHGLSVENTKFIRLCIDLQPIAQELILVVKKWAEYICFENMTTYALAMMCIFYLQVNGYLPSVETIRALNGNDHPTITGWKIIHYKLTTKEMQAQVKLYQGTVFELLHSFFIYYSKFDFNTDVVCPLLGQLVKRSQFEEANLESLPKEMSAYVDQLEGEDSEIFRYTSFMCVQDPFDLSHNLTKAAQQGTVTKFQTLCKLSALHMEGRK